ELSRFLAHRAAQGERVFSAVLFDLQAEQHIRQAINQTPTGNFLALPPDDASRLVDRIQSVVGANARTDIALVTSMDIR
ncbi:FHIPEP family type III secretion protein, partial [Burkholderia pseudomallei]